MTTSIDNSLTSFFIMANAEAFTLTGLTFIVKLVFKSLSCVLVFKIWSRSSEYQTLQGGFDFVLHVKSSFL